jgi:hypothetical protein
LREERHPIAAQDAREAALGTEAARADHLPAEAVRRRIAGENLVRVWREHRGMPQRALAGAAGMGAPYLSGIKLGRKGGSARILAALARALRVEIADLLPDDA